MKYQLGLSFSRRQAFYIAIMLLPANAWADLDYKCLSNCVSGGQTQAACMPKCNYGADAEALKKIKQKTGNPYNQFTEREAPEVVKKREEAEKEKQPVDYSCMPHCLNNGLQYKLCEEKCSDENPALKFQGIIPQP